MYSIKPYPDPFLRDGIYYFNYVDTTGKRRKKSTGYDRKTDARKFIVRFIDDMNNRGADVPLSVYAERFFLWDECPRVARKLAEGQQIGKEHVRQSRLWLEKYVFIDKIAKKNISMITRGDLLDLRDRLIKKTGTSTVNATMGAIKTVLSEAYYRGDIKHNPGQGIGRIKTKKKEKKILSPREIRDLFSTPDNFYSVLAYRLFLFYAYTGCRAGEGLALIWSQLDGSTLTINRSFTRETLKLPKWGKVRKIILPGRLLWELRKHRSEQVFCGPADFVFGHDLKKERIRMGYEFIKRHFPDVPDFSTHGFRHSLNTNLLTAGVDPILVQLYLGWSSRLPFTPVQQGYTHLSAFNLKPVTKAIGKMYGGGGSCTPVT